MSSPDRNSYLRNTILQAPPEQLQLMLYDGAIRFALQGRDAVLRKDYEATYEKLSRAQNIILEMESGLRPEVNREICEQMAALYHFVYGKLVNASVHRNASDIDDAVKILRHQRETWVMLLEKVAEMREDPDAGPTAETPQPGSLSIEG